MLLKYQSQLRLPACFVSKYAAEKKIPKISAGIAAAFICKSKISLCFRDHCHDIS